MFKIIPLIIGLVWAGQAVAACSGNSCKDVTITTLYVTADGDSVISTSGDESQLSCSAGASGYIKLKSSSTNYNATYSLLLAAHISQSPLWVRASDSGECTIGYLVSEK